MNDFASIIDETSADKIIRDNQTDAQLAAEIAKEAYNILLVKKTTSTGRIRKACRAQWAETPMLGDKLTDSVSTLLEVGVLEEIARCLKEAFGDVNPWSAAAKLFPKQAENGGKIVRLGLIAWLESFGLFDLDSNRELPITTSTMGTILPVDVVAIYMGQKNEPTKAETAAALREFCTDDWTENAEKVTDRISPTHEEYAETESDDVAAESLIRDYIEHVEQMYDDAVCPEELEAASTAAAVLKSKVDEACHIHRKSLRAETQTQLVNLAAKVTAKIAKAVTA